MRLPASWPVLLVALITFSLSARAHMAVASRSEIAIGLEKFVSLSMSRCQHRDDTYMFAVYVKSLGQSISCLNNVLPEPPDSEIWDYDYEIFDDDFYEIDGYDEYGDGSDSKASYHQTGSGYNDNEVFGEDALSLVVETIMRSLTAPCQLRQATLDCMTPFIQTMEMCYGSLGLFTDLYELFYKLRCSDLSDLKLNEVTDLVFSLPEKCPGLEKVDGLYGVLYLCISHILDRGHSFGERDAYFCNESGFEELIRCFGKRTEQLCNGADVLSELEQIPILLPELKTILNNLYFGCS